MAKNGCLLPFGPPPFFISYSLYICFHRVVFLGRDNNGILMHCGCQSLTMSLVLFNDVNTSKIETMHLLHVTPGFFGAKVTLGLGRLPKQNAGSSPIP